MALKVLRSEELIIILLLLCIARYSIGDESPNLRSRQDFQDPKSVVRKQKISSENLPAIEEGHLRLTPETMFLKPNQNDDNNDHAAVNLSFEFKNVGDLNLNDVDNEKIPCGVHKCFGRSKTDAEKGYLIIKNNSSQKHSVEYFQKQYEFGECLNQNYHIHTNVGYPHLTPVTQDRIDYIFENHPKREKRKADYAEGELIVLPVRYDPSAVQLTTCAKGPTFKDVQAHMEKHIPLNPDYRGRFVESIENIKVALGAKRCLYADFQVFVNSFGQVYLFDFDMCSGEDSCTSPDKPFEDIINQQKREEAESKIPKMYQDCIEQLDELVQSANFIAAKVSK